MKSLYCINKNMKAVLNILMAICLGAIIIIALINLLDYICGALGIKFTIGSESISFLYMVGTVGLIVVTFTVIGKDAKFIMIPLMLNVYTSLMDCLIKSAPFKELMLYFVVFVMDSILVILFGLLFYKKNTMLITRIFVCIKSVIEITLGLLTIIPQGAGGLTIKVFLAFLIVVAEAVYMVIFTFALENSYKNIKFIGDDPNKLDTDKSAGDKF